MPERAAGRTPSLTVGDAVDRSIIHMAIPNPHPVESPEPPAGEFTPELLGSLRGFAWSFTALDQIAVLLAGDSADPDNPPEAALEVGVRHGTEQTRSFLVRAVVRDWIDGDTLDVDIRLWFDLTLAQRVRVYGVNAPELRSADPAERSRAVAARDFCAALAPPGSTVQLASLAKADKYGRFLAGVSIADGGNVADRMIAAGHGVAYFGGKRS
jgi:micrococcal nuclease